MLRTRIFMLLLAAALVVLLFNLPRVVVDNAESGMTTDVEDQSPGPEASNEFSHDAQVSEEDQLKVNSLKALLSSEENQEKNFIFADSLAELYLEYRMYDSSATYFERAATLNPSLELWEKAGDAYYEAFTYAMDPEIASAYGDKVRNCYSLVIENDPQRLDLKTRIGMTLVSSSNPMEGITMLREVLAEDPKNTEALYNLGILAVQTGQYETAITRFENLVSADEDNVQGHFYLGICYKEVGRNDEAREQFLKVKELDGSSEVMATVDSYLEELK